jgi:SMI1 / KNR4 family (SUKH-1)
MDWIKRLKRRSQKIRRWAPAFLPADVTDKKGKRYITKAKPPVTPEDLVNFETLSGLKLPADLARVYLEVGNGGFGPGYGISELLCDESELNLYRDYLVKQRVEVSKTMWELGFSDYKPESDSMIEFSVDQRRITSGMLNWYLMIRDDSIKAYERDWPPHILPFCSFGCDLIGVVDVRNERIGFVQYEFFQAEPLESFIEWRANSAKEWFESWLNGHDLMYYSDGFWKDVLNPLFEKHHPEHVGKADSPESTQE